MRLNAFNIPTTNVEAMRNFYSLVLGAPYDGSHGGPNRYEIQIDGTCIVISGTCAPVSAPEGCGLEFAVDDVDALYAKLTAAGVKTESAPATLPWNWRFFAVKDPDGNNIDFVQNLGN